MQDQTGAAAGRYAVARVDNGHEHRLGIVSLDASGVMTVEESEPAESAALARLVHRMNGQAMLQISVAPPPGSPRFAVASRPVARGEAEFIPAMQDDLLRYYSIRLSPL
jgi:hypothetical protein